MTEKQLISFGSLVEGPKDWDKWGQSRRASYMAAHPYFKPPGGGNKPGEKAKEPEKKDQVPVTVKSEPRPEPKKEPKAEPKQVPVVSPRSDKEVAPKKTKHISHDEFQNSLEKHGIKSGKFVGGGVNAVYKVDTHNGVSAAYKPFTGNKALERDSKNAHAVSKLARMMGAENITPHFHIGTAPGEIEGMPGNKHHGSYMQWTEGDPIGYKAIIGSKHQDTIKHVKGDDIVKAAVLDTLINNRDRNYANLLVSKEGKLSLIDHDLTMGHSEGSLRSPFLPQSNYGDILKNTPYEHLHYTKHVPGGKIGKNYPKEIKDTLDHIVNSSSEDLSQELGIDHSRIKSLKKRAEIMVNDGFEAAVDQYAKKEPSRNPGVSPGVKSKPAGAKIHQPRISPTGKDPEKLQKTKERAIQRAGGQIDKPEKKPHAETPPRERKKPGSIGLAKNKNAERKTDLDWNDEIENKIDHLLDIEKSKSDVSSIRRRDLKQMQKDMDKGRWKPHSHDRGEFAKKFGKLMDLNKKHRG